MKAEEVRIQIVAWFIDREKGIITTDEYHQKSNNLLQQYANKVRQEGYKKGFSDGSQWVRDHQPK